MKAESKARMAVTAALCALLATSPVLGNVGVALANQQSGSDPVVRGAGEDVESQGTRLPYSKAGTYTATLRESDFAKAEVANAEQTNTEEAKAATAEAIEQAKATLEEAKASRDEASRALEEVKAHGEQTEAQAQTNASSAIEVVDDESTEKSDVLANADEAREQAEQRLAKAEEAVKVAEEEVSKLEGQTDAIQIENEEKRVLAFQDVKANDVKVSYVLAPTDSEGVPEAREAHINALSNDGGALTLSFTDPDAATNATSSYIVTIDALMLAAHVDVNVTAPALSVESGSVKSNIESCDVRIKAQDGAFAPGVSANDISLDGSFRNMSVTGVEATGDTLTAHLTGSPVRDYETEATWIDGQVTVAASGFENSPVGATACVSVDLPDQAFDLNGAEALPAASTVGETEYVGFDGNTAKATLCLYADMGAFNTVKAGDITLEDDFVGGKVESVTKQGEDNDMLKVEVSFPKGEESEDDYLYAGTLRLAAGAMSDESGKTAKEVSTTLLLAPEDMGKDGNDAEEAAKKAAEAKKKKQEAKAKKLSGIGEGFKYASGWVEKVDPALAYITDFGASVFGMASSYVKGDWIGLAKGGVGFLQMCGVVPAGEKEVTAADVLKEVKALRSVVKSIDLRTTDISKEDRENRYTQTSVRVKQMQDRITSAFAMFQKGAEMLATRKDNPMNPPAADAPNDEVVKYNNELVNLMLQQQTLKKEGKADGSMFVDVEDTIVKLKDDLSTVCKWVSIDKNSINAGANPIDVFDKLVSMKFNWDSQGYYARKAFRTELDATIKDAWAVISTYYNATDPAVVGKYEPDLSNVKVALQQIALRPAGQSPEEIRNLNRSDQGIKLYSPSLGITIKRSRYVNNGGDKFTDTSIGDDKVEEYKKRCGNLSIWEDLKLAGLEAGPDPASDPKFHGIAFRLAPDNGTYWSWSHGMCNYEKIWTYMLKFDKSAGPRNTYEYNFSPKKSAPIGPINNSNWVDFPRVTLLNEIYSHFIWFDR